MKVFGIFAAAVLLALSASAARLPTDVMLGNIDTLGEGLQTQLSGRLGEAWIRNHALDKKKTEKMARISTRFIISPSMRRDFIGRWQDLNKDVGGEKGNMRFELGKTEVDNVVFYGYGEWESWEDFMQHLDSDYMQDWLSFLAKSKIIYTWHPLSAPADDVMRERSSSRGRRAQHVLVRFTVLPEHHDDFIDTWQSVADKVDKKERGNIEYTLRKFETDNFQFFVCGSWESYDDWREHLESGHHQKLMDFAEDKDIAFFLSPLKKYGSEY